MQSVMTGKRRYKPIIVGCLFKRTVVLVQVEMEYDHITNAGGRVDVERLCKWVDAKPEWLMPVLNKPKKAAKHIAEQQAQIDALMLEYCPDEMTAEQLENWASHQVPVSAERQAKLEATIYDLQMADSHLEFISRVQDVGLHQEWNDFCDKLRSLEQGDG